MNGQWKTYQPSENANPLLGPFTVPGCKSISHRALIIPAACEREVIIENINTGHDVRATRNALETIGVKISQYNEALHIHPFNRATDLKTNIPLTVDMGNSGTSTRLLMGFFASLPQLQITLTGDSSLIKRPMARVQEPLSQMGANITLTEDGSKKTLPCSIIGMPLKGIHYQLPVASAQVKSALLLAGLRATGETILVEPKKSRNHTETMLQFLEQDILINDTTVFLRPLHDPEKQKKLSKFEVPGDPSAAAFWCVAASIIKGSNITIREINANPLRVAFINVLQSMNAHIKIKISGVSWGEPLWDLEVHSAPLQATTTRKNDSGALMDEYPILCVAAACAKGVTVFKGIEELRYKESNRIQKIVELLQAFGVQIKATDDTIEIVGQTFEQTKEPVSFDTGMDHRMAMCALILSRATRRGLRYSHPDCIETSFPTFNDQFQCKF